MEKERKVCRDCDRTIEEGEEFTEIDGEYLCEDCREEYFYCEDCDCFEHRDNGYWIESECKMVCQDCLDSNYTRCEDCGEYCPNDDMYSINNGCGDYYSVCDSCFNSGRYYECDDCGDYFHEEDMYFHDYNNYCCECEDNHRSRIYDYHEFDDWEFFKGKNEENPRYYIGKEIELEPLNYHSDVDSVVDAINDNINAVGMHDSSLRSGGVEVVTHPESWEYLQENKQKYIKFFDEIRNIDYGNAGGCGLHFHVSKPNENVISRIIVLMESFKDEIKKLSRREKGKLDRWAKFLTDNAYEEDKPKYQSTKWLKEKYLKESHDRYYALNLRNSSTIEFRFFDGVNNFEEYWGALQFIHNLMEIALDEEKELNTINWKDLLIGEELIEQAKKQGVYDIDKYAKDTTDIIEKYEKALEKARLEIKNILKNLAKYINKEMSEFDIKQIRSNDINEINNKITQFMEKFKYRQQYLGRVLDLYNALDRNDLDLHTIKQYWDNTTISYPVNTDRYNRYDKLIKKAIKKYESEVR